MVHCSAPGCNNSSTKGFLLKRFPRDSGRRSRWATNIQKTNWEPTNNSYICEVHFDDDQWETQRLDRLKWNAVPTIFHKRLKYIKRKERVISRAPVRIQPNMSCSINQAQSQFIYILNMDDYRRETNGSIDKNDQSNENPIKTMEITDNTNHKDAIQLSSDIEDNCEKDAVIAELRKEIAEKDMCLLKYEKIICQMNSHLEKLKGRLKFWKDFRERDKISLKKVQKLHKSCNM